MKELNCIIDKITYTNEKILENNKKENEDKIIELKNSNEKVIKIKYSIKINI